MQIQLTEGQIRRVYAAGRWVEHAKNSNGVAPEDFEGESTGPNQQRESPRFARVLVAHVAEVELGFELNACLTEGGVEDSREHGLGVEVELGGAKGVAQVDYREVERGLGGDRRACVDGFGHAERRVMCAVVSAD